jgi:hypothetical protein
MDVWVQMNPGLSEDEFEGRETAVSPCENVSDEGEIQKEGDHRFASNARATPSFLRRDAEV